MEQKRSTVKEGYVRSIDCTCYKELVESLNVKYLWLFKVFPLMSKTLQEVTNSIHFFLVVYLWLNRFFGLF